MAADGMTQVYQGGKDPAYSYAGDHAADVTITDAQKATGNRNPNNGTPYYTESTGRWTDPTRSSGADETLLGKQGWSDVNYWKQEWQNAKARGDQAAMDYAHQQAEAVRAQAGYSGGADGSAYIALPGSSGGSGSGTGSGKISAFEARNGGRGGTVNGANYDLSAPDLRPLLDQWQAAAVQQYQNQIDYAVNKGVTDLQRVEEDAQPMFKEQMESVARDERQGMDNSALRSALIGDNGGIGQSQYNEIQAQAAKNRLLVQQEQTKLSTDIARQIEDLRAQGEFQKADAALQVAQQYMQQLIGIEQWAAEYKLSTAQFQESIRQWENEFNLAMQKFRADVSIQNRQLDMQQRRYDIEDARYAEETAYNRAWNEDERAYSRAWNEDDRAYTRAWNEDDRTYSRGQDSLNRSSTMVNNLLSAGIQLTPEQIASVGITEAQENELLQYIQSMSMMSAAGGGGSSGRSSGGGSRRSSGGSGIVGSDGTSQWTRLFEDAAEYGTNDKSYIMNNYKRYGFSSSSALLNAYDAWKGKSVSKYSDLGSNAKAALNTIQNANNRYGTNTKGADPNQAAALRRRYEAGEITYNELQYMLEKLGIGG